MKSFLPVVFFIFLNAFAHSQTASVIKIDALQKRILTNSDTTYIVNFWATWCAPCVKELPDFDSIAVTFNHQKVKVLLVSLDFKEDLQTKLLPFIAAKKIKSEVVLLDETNGNYFIPKISDEWSGALPATWIVNQATHTKHFYEKKVNYAFLKNEIEMNIK